MDSDDDYQSLSPPKELSPQLQFRRLKRLKKSHGEAPKDAPAPLFDPAVDPVMLSRVDFAKLEELEKDMDSQSAEESDSPEAADLSQESPSQGVGNEVGDGKFFSESNLSEEANLSQDSLFEGVEKEVVSGDGMELGFDVEVRKTKRVLEFDDDVVGGSASGEHSGNLEPEKEKEMVGEDDLVEEKEEKQKHKKRREKSDGGKELKTKSRGPSKREEKERKEYLKELHAESQRLLRETGEASFKPIPVVQKPISSVLEKIRKRKLEISKKSMSSNSNYDGVEWSIGSRDRMMDLDEPERLDENISNIAGEELIAPLGKLSSLAASNVNDDDARSTFFENAHNHVPANRDPTPTFRAPADDTQDLFDDSEPIGTTLQNDEKPDSPLEENFAPSLLDMDLKLDSVPVDDDSSSDEEDNDKENFDPRPRGFVDDSSPNGDPVKDFIDEEAEEEDDSDDLSHSQENEVDEDIDDLEELNDMIATEYEERPTDKETRNELHQKWLEQQDVAGTDNLIQRLKCGSVLRDAFGTDSEHETDEDDEKDEEIDDEDEDEDEDSLPKESNKINVRKAKQIILKLYTGKEDTYLSDGDDDDDLQRRRAQCLIRKEERATITSPAADASSREVFGLIKKLNIASDNKRKPKAFSIFDSVLKGGSSDQSLKPSFVGRVSNHHIPSAHKQGPATVRSFIFGREDSNSRSSISISEDSSNSAPQEIRTARNVAAAKFNKSQTKVRNRTTDGAAEMISKTSLLEILKRSSSQSKVCSEETAVDLTKSIFAFRVPKKPTKVEGRG